MKNLKTLLLIGLLIGARSLLAFVPGITLGDPAHGGSGCPSGTISATLSPDETELSILFDDYYVEAGGDQRNTVRKSCNLAIPVEIPAGFSVSILSADYRGYVSLPSKAQARFTTEYFFAGEKGKKNTTVWKGYTDEDFDVSDLFDVTGKVWTQCGKDTILRINTSLLVRTNRKKEEALAILDSADLASGLTYYLDWKICW